MTHSTTTKEALEPWRDEGGHAWERHTNVECVECPHCCFIFAAVHTDGNSNGYSCPNCQGCPDAPASTVAPQLSDEHPQETKTTPCPFCGGPCLMTTGRSAARDAREFYNPSCDQCNYVFQDGYYNLEDAVKAWNSRVLPVDDNTLHRLICGVIDEHCKGIQLPRGINGLEDDLIKAIRSAPASPAALRDEAEQTPRLLDVAHRCNNGTYRPYPSALCSACRTEKPKLSIRDLCSALNAS